MGGWGEGRGAGAGGGGRKAVRQKAGFLRRNDATTGPRPTPTPQRGAIAHFVHLPQLAFRPVDSSEIPVTRYVYKFIIPDKTQVDLKEDTFTRKYEQSIQGRI